MPQNNFEIECDRLSSVVDGALFERLQWERNVGPVLARLVAFAHAALEKRGEFEFTEEGATRDVKRFVLKVHANRVMAVAMRVETGRAVLEAQPIDRSRYSLASGPPLSVAFEELDEQWMARALQELFSRVQS
uniref:hypothetical protein n=1 Tax=Altererythrobacter segetis TaxID=1104773 RepID=UPI001407AA95|nr:hypothetical protein [Altererythrobacter segetis]